MLSNYRKSSNPLYYIVILSTTIWIVSLLVIPLVNTAGLVSEYYLAVLANWAVLPVAMAFDIGILRQRYGFSSWISIGIIAVSTIPIIASLAGVGYLIFRSRVVSS